MHAKTGANNSYSEFVHVLNRIAERLGWHSLERLHIHLSGIKFGSKGELEHLNLKDSDLRYTDLLLALKDLDVKGSVICESPNLEEDALILQQAFKAT
jgi:deoxyribonuclease-4